MSLWFSFHFWSRDLLRELDKKYEVLLIIFFLVFLLFLVSEGLLFVSFFWTSFHSLFWWTLFFELQICWKSHYNTAIPQTSSSPRWRGSPNKVYSSWPPSNHNPYPNKAIRRENQPGLQILLVSRQLPGCRY